MKGYWILALALLGAAVTSPAWADKTYSCTAVQTKANTSVSDRASVSITSQSGVCNFSVNGAKSTTAANTSSGGTSGNEGRRPEEGSPSASVVLEAMRNLLSNPNTFDDDFVATQMASILLGPFLGADIPQDTVSALQQEISAELVANLAECVSGLWEGRAVFAGGDGVYCQTKDAEAGIFSPELAPEIVVEGLGGLLAIGVEFNDADFVTFITPELALAADIQPFIR